MSMTSINLDYPVEVQGERHAVLSMRRCRVRDRLAAIRAGGSDADKEVRLFALLCDVDPRVVEELDETDYAKLQEFYLGFTHGGGATRTQPS